MRMLFLAFCHVSAAVAYNAGARGIRRLPWLSPQLERAEHLTDLVLFFVCGGELEDARTQTLFRWARTLADWHRAIERLRQARIAPKCPRVSDGNGK